MSEPRRPPPPQSYIPLDLSNGPPKLPPRPTPADAGPPPNYTPPPPPLSDEEEDDEVSAHMSNSSKPHPPPPAPYQPRTQPPNTMQSLPRQAPPPPRGGLRPPPSRPARPPTANTPSPDSQLHPSPSSSVPPRPHPRAASTSSPRPETQSPSRSKTLKEIQPEITFMSAEPMLGDTIPSPSPSPTEPAPPAPPAPSRSHPTPSSPSTQSPRIPSRKAPTRPPPSKKAPSKSNSSLPQPTKEREAVDSSSGPVAPPRKPPVTGGSGERKKPPLRKSHTLPPHQRPAPPKPTPYRADRPPAPSRPPVKRSAAPSEPDEGKVTSSGKESPTEGSGDGIRIISARGVKQQPPQAKERTKPETKETTDTGGSDKKPQPQAKERTKPETKETTDTGDGNEEPQPQAKERTKPETKETTDTGDGNEEPQPQAKERTKPETKETTDTGDGNEEPQPQAKERTKPLQEPVAPSTEEEAASAKDKEGTEAGVKVIETRTAPPKPRRSVTREVAVSDGSAGVAPRVRPRASTVSVAKSKKSPSPSNPPEQQEGAKLGSVGLSPQPRPRASSSSLTRVKKPPPPSNPPEQQEGAKLGSVRLSPQPRPRASSSSLTRVKKPPPPSNPPEEQQTDRELPHAATRPPAPVRRPQASREETESCLKPDPPQPVEPNAPLTEKNAVKSDRPRPPPPTRQPVKQGTPSSVGDVKPRKPAAVTEPPKPQRRSQLITDQQLESGGDKQEKPVRHTSVAGKPRKPPVPQAPAPTPRKTEEPAAGETVAEDPQTSSSSTAEVKELAPAPLRRPVKPPPPVRQSSLAEKAVQKEKVNQEPRTDAVTAQKAKEQPAAAQIKSARPGKPPPPSRQPSQAGKTVQKEMDEGDDQEPRTDAVTAQKAKEQPAAAQIKSARPGKPPPPSRQPSQAGKGVQDEKINQEPHTDASTAREAEKQSVETPRKPGKPPPPSRQPNQSGKTVQKEMDEGDDQEPQTDAATAQKAKEQPAAAQIKSARPGKPPPPTQPSQAMKQETQDEEESFVTPSVPERGNTAEKKASEEGTGEEREEHTDKPNVALGQEPVAQEGTSEPTAPAPQPVKRSSKPAKPRAPMLIRPGQEEPEQASRPAEPKPRKVAMEGPSKPARPPAKPPARPAARPVTQPVKKEQSKEKVATTKSEAMTGAAPKESKVPPKPSKPPVPRAPRTVKHAAEKPVAATADPPSAPDRMEQVPKASQETPAEASELEPALPLAFHPATELRTGDQASAVEHEATQSNHSAVETPAEQTQSLERVDDGAPLGSQDGAPQPGSETESELEVPSTTERRAEDLAVVPELAEHEGKLEDLETQTAGEETQQEENAAETAPKVVLRRAAETSDIKQASHPKPSRPMSMPLGRPSKPGKPPPPSARQPTRSKPPKPAHGPSRPAHGPARPAHGPPRPRPLGTAQSRASRTPTTSPAHTPMTPGVDPPALPPRPAPGHLLYKYVCTEPHGIALTNHEPVDPDELAYEEGDVIELMERIDQHWFFARNADLEMSEGVLPSRDMRIVKKLPGESTVAGFEEGPCAVAMHTFQGQTMDELSFKEGDLIMLKTRIGDQWLRGKLVSGQEGIFPVNFVEIVEDLPADAVEKLPAPTQSQSTEEIHGPHCVAVFQFAAAGADELSLAVGDTVELVGRVGGEWLRGRLGGQEGIFPAQFVEVKVDLPAEPVGGEKGEAKGSWSKATFDFAGQEGELSFKAGARIKLLCRVNEDWVEGATEEGAVGIFPASFVDNLPPDLPAKSDTAEATPVKPTGKCKAAFDFTGENSGELSFKVGDVIETTEWVNEEWMTGCIGEREGMFPLAFVKVLVELPKPAASKKPAQGRSHFTKLDDNLLPRAEAIQDFSAANSQQLNFKRGDVLNLLEKIGSDWYSGENTRTGAFGDFPASSVRVIVPLP